MIQSKPEGTKAARVSQHYRRALTTVMTDLYSSSDYVIVIEDDLQISPDFFFYMAHVLPIFKMDSQVVFTFFVNFPDSDLDLLCFCME